MNRRGGSAEAFFRVLGAVICDVVIAFGGAWLLWVTGTTSVADAPTMTFVIVVLATAFLVIVRHTVLGRGRHRGAVVESVLVADVAITAVLAGTWLADSNYFLGWVACYCAVLLLVMGIFELFGLAADRARVALKNAVWADFVRFFVVIGAIGGLVATAEVHYWNLAILNAALLTAATGIGIGIVCRAVLFRSPSETPEDVVDDVNAEIASDDAAPVDTAPADAAPADAAPADAALADAAPADAALADAALVEAGALEHQAAETGTSRRRSGGSRTIDASNI